MVERAISENEKYPQYCIGVCSWGGASTECILCFHSPPDQESIFVILLTPFLCAEAGKVIQIQRREFIPTRLQEDL